MMPPKVSLLCLLALLGPSVVLSQDFNNPIGQLPDTLPALLPDVPFGQSSSRSPQARPSPAPQPPPDQAQPDDQPAQLGAPPPTATPPPPDLSQAPDLPTAMAPQPLFGPPLVPLSNLPNVPQPAPLLGPPAAPLGPLPGAFSVGQPVKTSSGMVFGQEAKFRPEVSEYLGIPYAVPPVGPLRFAAPQKLFGVGNISATNFGADCPSNVIAINPKSKSTTKTGKQLLNNLNQAGDRMSEDCLTLNIWSKPQTGQKLKAVMVWIHGGGFETGSAANPIYNGQVLADNSDVVVVNFNYRLNVFGFPGLSNAGPAVPQNPGLLDQRMALEWIRDNIAGFNGDPKRIILFGQSAGAASVDLYSFSYSLSKDPIVAGFIAESGTATSFFNPAPNNNTQVFAKAAMTLGCGDINMMPIDDVLGCVRTKSMEDVLKAINEPNPFSGLFSKFGPTVDNQVVFSDYEARAREGNFIQKPMLIGNNDYEAGLFRIMASASPGMNVSDSEWCLFNLAFFTCPAALAANTRSRYVPTFRYRYFADFNNVRLTDTPNSRAYHGAEVPLIFGTTETFAMASPGQNSTQGSTPNSSRNSVSNVPPNIPQNALPPPPPGPPLGAIPNTPPGPPPGAVPPPPPGPPLGAIPNTPPGPPLGAIPNTPPGPPPGAVPSPLPNIPQDSVPKPPPGPPQGPAPNNPPSSPQDAIPDSVPLPPPNSIPGAFSSSSQGSISNTIPAGSPDALPDLSPDTLSPDSLSPDSLSAALPGSGSSGLSPLGASSNPQADSLNEDQIKTIMQKIWTSFSRDPFNNLMDRSLNLPMFNPSTRSSIHLAVSNDPNPRFVYPSETDAMCPIVRMAEAKIPGGLISVLVGGRSMSDIIMSSPGISMVPGIGNLTALLKAPLSDPTVCPGGLG